MAQITSGGTPYYYHAEQLGSIRAVTDGSGAVANSTTYDAYGSVTASIGGGANPFGYAGEYTDAESGLLYLRARYYDPATQQFLTVDPLLAATEQAYNYTAGNPLNFTDPAGLDRYPQGGAGGGRVSTGPVPDPGGYEGTMGCLACEYQQRYAPGSWQVDWTQPLRDMWNVFKFFGGGGGTGGTGGGSSVTLYRAETDWNQRFIIDANGNVSLVPGNNKMLSIGFDPAHAEYFLNKRVRQGWPNPRIVSCQVDENLLRSLRREYVEQWEGPRFPDRPQLLDPNKGTDLYGIPSNWFEYLMRSVIQGTGRMRGP